MGIPVLFGRLFDADYRDFFEIIFGNPGRPTVGYHFKLVVMSMQSRNHCSYVPVHLFASFMHLGSTGWGLGISLIECLVAVHSGKWTVSLFSPPTWSSNNSWENIQVYQTCKKVWLLLSPALLPQGTCIKCTEYHEKNLCTLAIKLKF